MFFPGKAVGLVKQSIAAGRIWCMSHFVPGVGIFKMDKGSLYY